MRDGKLVTATVGDGEATIVAKELPINKSLEFRDLWDRRTSLTNAETKRMYELLAATLVKVEGLENAEGEPLTVDDVRNLNVSATTLIVLSATASAALNPPAPEGEEEKNDGGGDSPAA